MSTLRVGNLEALGGTGTITVPTGNKIAQTGAVLQVVSTTKLDTFSSTSTTFTDLTGLSASITPSSTSSLILVMFHLNTATGGSNSAMFQIVRGSTAVGIGTPVSNRVGVTSQTYLGDQNAMITNSMIFLDSPATTSSTTYKLQTRLNISGTVQINRSMSDNDSSAVARGASTLTLMEIAG